MGTSPSSSGVFSLSMIGASAEIQLPLNLSMETFRIEQWIWKVRQRKFDGRFPYWDTNLHCSYFKNLKLPFRFSLLALQGK